MSEAPCVGRTWTIGAARVTAVLESESITSPRFLFKGLTKPDVLDLATRATWLRPHFVDADGYLLQRIQCLVVEADGLCVAVDTCIGNDKVRHNAGWSGLQLPFLEALAAAGFTPERIDLVVCTHLHVDHVGWNTRLVDGRWVPTFPNARYLFVRPELEHWQVTPNPDGDVFGDSVAPIVEAGLADLVAVDHRVSPSVRFDHTPGHTPGHVCVVVESGGERAVITGDMIHTPVQIADVRLSSAFDTDPALSVTTREGFLERYLDTTTVIGTHWGGPGGGRVRRSAAGDWSIEAG